MISVSSLLLKAHDTVEACDCEEGCAECTYSGPLPRQYLINPSDRCREPVMSREQPGLLEEGRLNRTESHPRPTYRRAPTYWPREPRDPRNHCRSHASSSLARRGSGTCRLKSPVRKQINSIQISPRTRDHARGSKSPQSSLLSGLLDPPLLPGHVGCGGLEGARTFIPDAANSGADAMVGIIGCEGMEGWKGADGTIGAAIGAEGAAGADGRDML